MLWVSQLCIEISKASPRQEQKVLPLWSFPPILVQQVTYREELKDDMALG